MKKLIILLCVLASSMLFAQETYFELLRQDLSTKKVALITDVMQFTDAEAEVFWPMYREYDFERQKIGDELLKLIKEYAKHFQDLTDEKATELMNKNLDLKGEKNNLNIIYFRKFSTIIAPARAAKFMQVMNQIDLIIDTQLASQIPLIGEKINPMPPEEENQM
ncbi:MAG: hypothetical protein P8X73_09250 [Ignavibacteriaceae bacterium]|jgi:hypothetical protein